VERRTSYKPDQILRKENTKKPKLANKDIEMIPSGIGLHNDAPKRVTTYCQGFSPGAITLGG
jgi:hypothetical protein